jgi:hypothetical protein
MPIDAPPTGGSRKVCLPNVVTMVLLLHYYYQNPDNLSIAEPHLSSPAMQDAQRWLLNHALINSEGCTERGKCFVEHLGKQPIPVPRTGWEMPSV